MKYHFSLIINFGVFNVIFVFIWKFPLLFESHKFQEQLLTISNVISHMLRYTCKHGRERDYFSHDVHLFLGLIYWITLFFCFRSSNRNLSHWYIALILVLFNNWVPNWLKTHLVAITKTRLLMLVWDRSFLFSKSHETLKYGVYEKYINILTDVLLYSIYNAM
jgi:hypothetical protein